VPANNNVVFIAIDFLKIIAMYDKAETNYIMCVVYLTKCGLREGRAVNRK